MSIDDNLNLNDNDNLNPNPNPNDNLNPNLNFNFNDSFNVQNRKTKGCLILLIYSGYFDYSGYLRPTA